MDAGHPTLSLPVTLTTPIRFDFRPAVLTHTERLIKVNQVL